MSTGNILSITPMHGGGCRVEFRCHRGPNRTYYYGAADAAAIMSGDDPANYDGSDSPLGASGSGGFATSMGDAIIDAGEML
jgi:hypothetical protein